MNFFKRKQEKEKEQQIKEANDTIRIIRENDMLKNKIRELTRNTVSLEEYSELVDENMRLKKRIKELETLLESIITSIKNFLKK